MATASGSAPSSGGSTGSSSPGASSGIGGTINPEAENQLLAEYLFIILASIAGTFFIWRLANELFKWIRMVASLNNGNQRYFATPSSTFSWFKREVMYAPIFQKRHNREFMLSSAVNVGTLPTRLQLGFLIGYFATNVVFVLLDIDLHGNFQSTAAQLRNRSGVLAVVNLIPLVVMAGRNQPLIKLLNISFDTFNLLHRWFGRIVILEAITHVLAYLISSAQEQGWGAAFDGIFQVSFTVFGFIAVCAFLAIGLQAGSIVRHAFYETFKVTHIALAALAVAGLWYHLKLQGASQIMLLYGVIASWAIDRLIRFFRIGYGNIGAGGTKTLIEALPGDACRVTVTMARPWRFQPGQHAYLYFPSIGYWQSHPFSVAWSEEVDDLPADELPLGRQDILSMRKTSMAFVIRARTGLTKSLYDKASKCVDGRLRARCFVEGPYGGMHKLHSYGTVMLFAGGVGITQATSHASDLIKGSINSTIATRKVTLVWITQSSEHLEWVRPWLTQLLSMERQLDMLRIMVFVSRPGAGKEMEVFAPSETVELFNGRPDVGSLLAMELEQPIGAVGVSVCGPGALSDEVRRAVRQRQYQKTIDFVEEAFSW